MIRDYNDEELVFIKSKIDLIIGLKKILEAGYSFEGESIYLSTDYDNLYETKDAYYDFITRILGYRTEYTEATESDGEVLGYNLFMDPEEIQIIRYLVNHPVLDEYLSHFKNYDELPRSFLIYVQDICDGYPYYGDYEHSEAFVAKNLSGIVILHSHMEWVGGGTAEALMDIIEFCRKENELRKAGEQIHDTGYDSSTGTTSIH